MCGIWAWIYGDARAPSGVDTDRLWARGVKTLDARGPEGHKWMHLQGASWCFTRLAINGLNTSGMQPFEWNDGRWSWMCNGEIYNSRELEDRIPYLNTTGSDCEVLGALWESCEGDEVAFARALDGVFALVLFDEARGEYIVARDPYGVRPLYWFVDGDGYRFASERKALEPFAATRLGAESATKIHEFPPGQVWKLSNNGVLLLQTTYHTTPWLKSPVGDVAALRAALEAAVEKRLMTERPVAALLSGGVDSSLIAALVQERLRARGLPPLKTFSIGMEGGTDLAFARKVAEHIGSDHTEVVVTAEEMFEAIPQVIRDIESYDITTVRASVGNWLVARAIRAQTDCKVVFNGDGSDEIFGGYLYFRRAPSDFAFERETERLLEQISKYDVLRSDRSMSSHGLEARTPFLDKQFVAVAMSYPTVERRPSAERIEKHLLRSAFAGTGLLPDEVLWRRKEAFSDGVSAQEKSWYQIVQDLLRERGLVPEDWQETAAGAGWWPQPATEEAFYYRFLYESYYQATGDPWPFWMPRWSPETSDPSARTLGADVLPQGRTA
jgi:asparagine synthase (glutamine-hydrolysing)